MPLVIGAPNVIGRHRLGTRGHSTMGYENEQFAYAAPTGLSCGASCGCQACKTGAVGLGERYVSETDGGSGARERGVGRFAEAPAPAPPRPSAPPPRAPAPQTAAGRLPLTRVADATVPPWRAVCRIVARQDDTGFAVGSGILVSPYHVLTCAHVIFPPQAPNTRQITVFPGQNGPDSAASGFKATGWAVSPRWKRTDCTTDHEDYGIIRLPVQHGFVPPIPFNPADLLAALVTLAGYPGSKEPAARHLYKAEGAFSERFAWRPARARPPKAGSCPPLVRRIN